MNWLDFTKILEKKHYSYGQIGALREKADAHLYQEFFQNYGENDWPEDPDHFIQEIMKFHQQSDEAQWALSPRWSEEDYDQGRYGSMELKPIYEYLELGELMDAMEEEESRLYQLMLDVLGIAVAEDRIA